MTKVDRASGPERDWRRSETQRIRGERDRRLGAFILSYEQAAERLNEARHRGRLKPAGWATGMAELLIAGWQRVTDPGSPLGESATAIYMGGVLTRRDAATITRLRDMHAEALFDIMPQTLANTLGAETSEGGLRVAVDPIIAKIAVHRVVDYPAELVPSSFLDHRRPIGYLAGYQAMMSTPTARSILMGPGMDWRRAVSASQPGAYVDGISAEISNTAIREAVQERAVGQQVANMLNL